MKFPFYSQHDFMDCGPTCLRMVAKYYGKHIAVQKLREWAEIGKNGVNMLGMSEAAEAVGFRTKAVKISYRMLVNDAPLPTILHWGQAHFVVLYKTTKSKLMVADPAGGLITYKPEEFKKKWISTVNSDNVQEGVTLLLEPTPRFYQYENDAREQTTLQIKNLLRYVLPYKNWVFQLIAALAISTLFSLGLPFLTQSVVDKGVNAGNLHFVYVILLAQAALLVGRLMVDFIRSWILLHISVRINVSILTDFLIKLMKLPIGFFDSKQTGDILQRMNDHHRIESFLTNTSLNTLFSLFNLVVFSIVLLTFDEGIFVVFALASLLYAGWIVLFLQKRKVLDHKRFEIASREQGATIELVQGMQEIKLQGCEKSMRWNWERLQAQLYKLSMKSLGLTQWQQSGAFFINEGKNILITFLSARAAIQGEISLGTMLAIQYIIGQLNSPIEQFITFLQNWQYAKISMDRLNEIQGMDDEEPATKNFVYQLPAIDGRQLVGGKSIVEPGVYPLAGQEATGLVHAAFTDHLTIERNDMQPLNELPGIWFRNVWFTYAGAGNEPVLSNINLQIPIGKTTAIVGVSGSGKTTILKLLLKFYEAQKGEIVLKDEHEHELNFSHVSHRSWRQQCGVVMQESYIFNDSIARNIAVGEENVDMEKLKQAAVIANIDDFIDSLPNAFNTKIGAEGAGISMGQKQRILIARAVYRNPAFIFFDEATNSLDANNESIIIENLESFFKGRTVVVVAHRLSTVRSADQIIVLNKGVITEKGTHQELINLKGEYFTLVKNQLELGN